MAKAASSTGAKTGRQGTGILKVVPVSKPLANFIGENEVSRTTAVKKIWEYIKLNNLQVRVCFIFSNISGSSLCEFYWILSFN